MGGKFGEGRVIAQKPLDNAFPEISGLAGGYMIVEGESLESAIEVAERCPGLVGPGCGHPPELEGQPLS